MPQKASGLRCSLWWSTVPLCIKNRKIVILWIYCVINLLRKSHRFYVLHGEKPLFLNFHLPVKVCPGNYVREGFFWFPSARPFALREGKIAFFLNGRFLKDLGRLPLRRCVFLRFHFLFWGAPARPSISMTLSWLGPKKRLPLVIVTIIVMSNQSKLRYGFINLCIYSVINLLQKVSWSLCPSRWSAYIFTYGFTSPNNGPHNLHGMRGLDRRAPSLSS